MFQILEGATKIQIIRITNDLATNARVIVNFVYSHHVVGEIVIRSGYKSVTYYANLFLNRVAMAESVEMIRNITLMYINRLTETNKVYRSNLTLTMKKEKRQEILEEFCGVPKKVAN